MVAIERLNEDDLRELSGRTDSAGVLSVYVNADPAGDANRQAAEIDLSNRFRELQRRVSEDGAGPGERRATTAALERVWPQIQPLAGPIASGRSRIAFVALSGDWSLHLDGAMPVGNRVVLDDGPFIHPLLELLDEGRPAGVALVSADEIRIAEWRVGSLRELSRMEQPYVEAPHERAGQIGGGPQGQYNTPVREQRQTRQRDLTQRFLDQATGVLTALAGERGWERILVSGGERWTERAVGGLAQSLRDKVFADPRNLSGLDEAALTATVSAWAHDQHKDDEQRLLQRVRDAAGNGNAALGLSEVAAALNAGRVYRLVYDPEVRYAGTVGADGAIYGGDEIGPDGRPGAEEPRLTERLVERAFETGARISPVEGAAAGTLSDVDGVAALLRW
ncbi:hypothetical protein ABQE69_12820 [Mycolicibacillus trivialis]|uniref:Uncharacterized protein n=1 Tax=Mycolicibacillus trivialis TaxID=1798 RepID=A0A1X2EN14_9MYCO|nr:hypothetical protein [Mycolicibacillus trivialis]ORX06992.1 hypothetical protein AWC30_05370 [Mycolicibacillus trivialis]